MTEVNAITEKSHPNLKIGLMGLIITLVVLSDQISKQVILMHFTESQVVPVIPGFFNLTLRFNPGAAFGMLAGLPDWQRQILLVITTTLALSCVGYFLIKRYFSDVIGQAALALIMGGAFGNIIDRVRIGEVVDFLDFYFARYHWPAFNVADSAICVGVGLLILKQPKHPKPSEP